MKDGIGNKIITEGTITNGLSRETGNIGHKTQATLGYQILDNAIGKHNNKEIIVKFASHCLAFAITCVAHLFIFLC
jgi:hypothetical protein